MKIPGIPVGTTAPRPNWNQNDPKKADYIRNKPSFEAKQNRLAWVTDEDVEAMLSGTYEGVGEETYLNDDLVVDTLYALTDVIVAGKSFKDFEPGSGGGGGSADLSNYYDKEFIDLVIEDADRRLSAIEDNFYDGSYTDIEGGGAIDLANIPKVDSIDNPTEASPTAVSYDDAIYLLVEGEINDGI